MFDKVQPEMLERDLIASLTPEEVAGSIATNFRQHDDQLAAMAALLTSSTIDRPNLALVDSTCRPVPSAVPQV